MTPCPPPPWPHRRALLIVNERSRSGGERRETVEAGLRAAGLVVVAGRTRSREDVSERIREMAAEVDRVVIGGGDGTVNAAARGLIETGLPLGILPLGTANDLARTLNLPMTLEAAIAVAAGERRRRIDLGAVNGHPYFNVASLGFGVDLTRALTGDAKKRWGPLGYAVAGARVIRRMRPFHAEITIGERRTVSRTVHLAVGNGRHYGGGMTVHAEAAIDDGKLDVYSLEIASAWRLLTLIPALRSGKTSNYTAIRTLVGQEIRVATHRERSVNADGEIVTRTPATFRVLHDAVSVLVPG